MTLKWDHYKEYYTWQSVKQRCTNCNATSYENYGGRGIKVCDRWFNSFANFLEDMGDAPTKNHSIERVNVNGDYEPNNCIWIPLAEQKFNRRPKPPETAHRVIHPFRPSSNPAYCAIIRPDEIPGRPEYKGETDEVRKRIKKPNAWI